MNKFSDKSLLVFDMDGTLVDSMTHFGEIAARVIARHYGKEESWALQAYRDTSGLPFPFQLEKLFPGDFRNSQAAAEFFRQKEDSYNEALFYDDMEPTLVELKKRGYALAVSSNNEHELLMNKLRDKKILFDLILGYRPSFSKGAEHFNAMSEMLGAAPHEMLFVGDSLHDAVMAHAHQISFAAKLGTFTEADFHQQGLTSVFVHQLSELIPLLIHDKQATTSPADRDLGRGFRHSVGR